MQWLSKWTKQIPFEGKISFSPIWCVKTKCGFGYVLDFCIQNAFRMVHRCQSKKQNTPLFYWIVGLKFEITNWKTARIFTPALFLLFTSWVARSVQWLGYGQDERKIPVYHLSGVEIFLIPTEFRPPLRSTQHAKYWAKEVLYARVKWSGCDIR